MRWTIKENEIGYCPTLRVEDLPETIPANMRILHKNGVVGVLCENVAGILPCKNGNEILIEPKYSKVNPLEMLLYVNSISGIAVNRDRLASGKGEVDLQTIAASFVEQLSLIAATAKKFHRKPKVIASSSVVGKVDWMKTLMGFERKNSTAIITTVREESLDIPENALIAAAAQKVINLYASSSPEYAVLSPWAQLAVQFKHSYRELFSLQVKLSESKLSGAHGFYYAPVMLSKIILGFAETRTSVEEVNTILFNMPSLYEDFIRTGFQRAGAGYGLTIQKGLTPRGFLFYEGECELIPDITIYEGTKIKAVLDVKYKIPDSKDFYQIFSYMQYAHLKEAFVVSPAVEPLKVVTAFDGSKVHFVRVANSDASNLEILAKKIIRVVN